MDFFLTVCYSTDYGVLRNSLSLYCAFCCTIMAISLWHVVAVIERKGGVIVGSMRQDTRKHYEEMKALLCEDVLKGRKKFSWRRILLRCWRQPGKRFIVWWRIANCLFLQGGSFRRRLAHSINRKLERKYNTEIMLGATIGGGLRITHYHSIVVSHNVVAGKNLLMRQNTTIGTQNPYGDRLIKIGDNVNIGANSCIIGDRLTIGDNVTIGAMSFINKDIPSDSVVYTEKIQVIKSR